MTGSARQASGARQFLVALFIQLAKVRRTWFFQFLIPSLIAFGTIWLASRIAAANTMSRASSIRYVTGAAFVAAMFGTLNAVTNELSWTRAQGELEYLATFPLRKSALLVSFILPPVCYAVPGVLVVLWAGSALLRVDLRISPVFPLVLLLGQLMLTCVGAALALSLPRRLASTAAAGIPLLLMIFTPVLYPASALPVWMERASDILPSTMIVDLFEASLFGTVGSAEWAKIGIVATATLAIFAYVVRMPGWRR